MTIEKLLIATEANTHAQLSQIKESSDSVRERVEGSIERLSKIQNGSTKTLEKRIDQKAEKVSSQLSTLERCQNHYFPSLISFVKSISGIVATSNNRIKDVQDCQRTYFPRIFFAIQLTLVKLEDLATLGVQLLAA